MSFDGAKIQQKKAEVKTSAKTPPKLNKMPPILGGLVRITKKFFGVTPRKISEFSGIFSTGLFLPAPKEIEEEIPKMKAYIAEVNEKKEEKERILMG